MILTEPIEPIELVFCSSNSHKAIEMRSLLPPWVKMLTLTDVGFVDEIQETGSSFSENAFIKAREVHGKTGRDAFADDSGLVVDGIGGLPGIHTARYAGPGATSEQNMQKLLSALQGVADRRARFVCCIALIHNHKEVCFEGVVEGRIALEKSGSQGFGYDPIFVPDGFRGSFAELSDEVKNQISHRGKAIRQMMDWLSANRAS